MSETVKMSSTVTESLGQISSSSAGAIYDKDVLNELRDRLMQAGLATAATGRWEAKRVHPRVLGHPEEAVRADLCSSR